LRGGLSPPFERCALGASATASPRGSCANQAPDHTTIARFRQRHESALASLFGECWRCAEAGLVSVGLIATDGTKARTRRSMPIVTTSRSREILEEADAVDAAEDERFGTAGDAGREGECHRSGQGLVDVDELK
jgi:hypothetical protein